MIYYSLMEEPGKGRSEIIHDGMDLKVIINHRRHPLVILFSIFFIALMFLWGYSLILIAGGITDLLRLGDSTGAGFVIIWLIVWLCAGIGMLIMIIWALKRRETITVTSDTLKIERKALGIGRTVKYAISNINNLRLNRIREPEEGLSNLFKSYFWESRIDMLGTRPGNLVFDYLMSSINFAREIDEPEAKYLLKLFKERGIPVYASDKI